MVLFLFVVYNYSTMHGAENIKFATEYLGIHFPEKYKK
jgi:hypothetical protein